MKNKLAIVLPAKNEASNLGVPLLRILEEYGDAEVIQVNDGSVEETVAIAISIERITCVTHPVSIGNGRQLKQGPEK